MFSYKKEILVRAQVRIYKTPFVVVGGPIGPRLDGGVVGSAELLLPPTTLFVDTTDDVLVFGAFVVKLVLSEETPLPIETPAPVVLPAAAAEVVNAFVVDFVMKNFSNLAIICFPYVYLRNEFICGRILCIKIFRCVGSDTSIIFCTT